MSLFDDLMRQPRNEENVPRTYMWAFELLCDRVERLESELKALRGDVPEPPRHVWFIGQRVAVVGYPDGTIAGTDRDGDPIVVHDGESIKRPRYAQWVTPL